MKSRSNFEMENEREIKKNANFNNMKWIFSHYEMHAPVV